MPLCETCASLDPATITETHLGIYTDLCRRAESGCDACAFFSAVLQSSSRWKSKLDDLAGRVIVLDNLRLDARRPERLSSRSYSHDDLCLDVCVAGDYEGPLLDELDIIRPIPVNSRDEKCQRLISTWISECIDHHDTCSSSVPGTGSAAPVLPRRVIEVPSDPDASPHMCLAEGRTGRYIVLSYYAGDVEVPELQGLDDTDLPAAVDVARLPRTLADAVDLTRRLGYRYLWVREFCSSTAWDQDVYETLAVYAQTTVMLAVDDGVDANAGVFHDRRVLYSPALGPNRDRYLRPGYLQWKSEVDESRLAGCGWEIIERLLAPRIVHFTERQMIWECASGFQFEGARVTAKEQRDNEARPQSQGDLKRLVQPYITSALQRHQNTTTTTTTTTNATTPQDDQTSLATWHRCIDQFSPGHFKNPSDKLPAIGILAAAINNASLGPYYLAGIWSKNIALGLAWSRPYHLLHATPTYRAPSWSWASVDGTVSSLAAWVPADLMRRHAEDPAWMERYGPKLRSYDMVLADPRAPYGGVLEGSHIVLEGSCVGFRDLVGVLNRDGSGFSMTPVLDRSQVFDCSCCAPRAGDVREREVEEFDREVSHHVCMVLCGDAWRTSEHWERDRGFCILLILRALGEEGLFERVGLTMVRLDFDKPEDPHAVFDSLGWERRVLKLV